MAKLSCGLSIPGVTEKNGRYFKIVRNEWLPLTRVDEGRTALLKRLDKHESPPPGTYGQLILRYEALGMDDLKEVTRKRYASSLRELEHHFGRMRINAMKKRHVAVWLENARQQDKGGIAANRTFAVLSNVQNFGMRNGWLEDNPCHGVRRNPEKPRKRYVTDEELRDAFERSPEPFQDLLQVAFLSGARQTDLINWRRTSDTPLERCLTLDGLDYIESKTGKPRLVEWSKDLYFHVRRSMDRADSEYVLTNKFGQQWGVWAINSQIARLNVNWAFRDLRAKAQTDAPHAILGHGAAMEEVYRKARRTKPVR